MTTASITFWIKPFLSSSLSRLVGLGGNLGVIVGIILSGCDVFCGKAVMRSEKKAAMPVNDGPGCWEWGDRNSSVRIFRRNHTAQVTYQQEFRNRPK